MKKSETGNQAFRYRFWEQPISSSSTLDGNARQLPDKAAPTYITHPSGLSRIQYLVATQTLGIPVQPAFCGNQGGLVFDRVLACDGQANWWASLAGRAKAQRIIRRKQANPQRARQPNIVRSAVERVFDLDNYACNVKGSMFVNRQLSMYGSVEADSIGAYSQIRDLIMNPNYVELANNIRKISAKVGVKHKLSDTLQLDARATQDTPYFDDATQAYCYVPRTISIDVGTRNRRAPLLYRVGIHQTWAPAHERCEGVMDLRPGGIDQTFRTCLHVQGGLALRQDDYLWRKTTTSSQGNRTRARPRSGRNRLAALAGLTNGQEQKAQGSKSVSSKGTSQPVVPVAAVALAVSDTDQTPPAPRESSTQQKDFATTKAKKGNSSVSKPIKSNGTWWKKSKQADTRSETTSQSIQSLAEEIEQTQPEPVLMDGRKVASSGSDNSTKQSQLAQKNEKSPWWQFNKKTEVEPKKPAMPIQQIAEVPISESNGEIKPSSEVIVSRSSLQHPGTAEVKQLPSVQQREPQIHNTGYMAESQKVDDEGSWLTEWIWEHDTEDAGWRAGELPLNRVRGGGDVQSVVADEYSDEPTKPLPKKKRTLKSIAKEVRDTTRKYDAVTFERDMEKTKKTMRDLKLRIRDSTAQIRAGHLRRAVRHWCQGPFGPRSSPYLLATPSPHCKVTRTIGCVGRIPFRSVCMQQLDDPYYMGSHLSTGGADIGNVSTRGGPTTVPTTQRGLAPSMKDLTVRAFFSGGISLQLGRFKKRMLDMTAIQARLDLGITEGMKESPHYVTAAPRGSTRSRAGGSRMLNSRMSTVSQSGKAWQWADKSQTADPGSRPAVEGVDVTQMGLNRHRAFTLEGKNVWNALNVSVQQQVYGPVRALADFRFRLNGRTSQGHTRPSQSGFRNGPIVLGMVNPFNVQPQLLDAVYGADLALPTSAGRLVAWYAPMRKEGMLEFRIDV